jgi:transcriptional regulator with XRE-family HTH domain
MNLKTEREKRGLSQGEVAQMMGMDRTAYWRIESGYRGPTRQQKASFEMAMRLHDLKSKYSG